MSMNINVSPADSFSSVQSQTPNPLKLSIVEEIPVTHSDIFLRSPSHEIGPSMRLQPNFYVGRGRFVHADLMVSRLPRRTLTMMCSSGRESKEPRFLRKAAFLTSRTLSPWRNVSKRLIHMEVANSQAISASVKMCSLSKRLKDTHTQLHACSS